MAKSTEWRNRREEKIAKRAKAPANTPRPAADETIVAPVSAKALAMRAELLISDDPAGHDAKALDVLRRMVDAKSRRLR